MAINASLVGSRWSLERPVRSFCELRTTSDQRPIDSFLHSSNRNPVKFCYRCSHAAGIFNCFLRHFLPRRELRLIGQGLRPAWATGPEQSRRNAGCGLDSSPWPSEQERSFPPYRKPAPSASRWRRNLSVVARLFFRKFDSGAPAPKLP